MFSRILVPLDGRDVSAAALSPALTVALATAASICLLSVLDDDATDASKRAAETHLSYLAAGLSARGASVNTRIVTGSAADQIVAAAIDAKADLIAMATHGRSGLSRTLFGSVTERVVARSPTPALLIRPGAREPTRIGSLLVPVDGSPGGALALASAIALAQPVGARIILLQVVVPAAAYQMDEAWAYGGSHLNPAWDEEALAGARRYVTGLAERVRATCPDVEGRAEIGDTLPPITSVVECITAVAEQAGADMIVMSTHAHTGPVRALLGSVADAVVRTAHRPVLLVRRAAPLEEPGQAALDRPRRALESSGRG